MHPHVLPRKKSTKRPESTPPLTLKTMTLKTIDKSDALWSFNPAFQKSHQNSHASWMTFNIKKTISIESFQGENWVRTELSQKHAQAILRAIA